MAPTIKNVALAGATGQLGSRILTALVNLGHFNITILTRNAAPTSFPEGVITREVDYTSTESLVDAIRGQDAVIDSTHSYESEGPRRLLDACVEVGVYRYIPPEFGSDPISPDVQALPFFRRKTEIAKYRAEKLKGSSLTWTAVACGPFLEAIEDGGLGIDVEAKKIAWYGEDGHLVSPFSTLEAVGKATAQVLLYPEETANRVVYISSVNIGQRRLVELAKEALGSDGWIENIVDIQDEYEWAQAKLRKGEFKQEVIMAILRYSMTSAAHTYTWPKSDNALLGVEEFSDAEVKEFVLKSAGVVA
ncbi:Ff.00g086010.m01.CDS01 [Fusarium sp. VM40]|nr:Ff.00g086010.m01.CDS01 [Fusarium sp. VM40]